MSAMFAEVAERLGLTFEVGNGLAPTTIVHGTLDGQAVRGTWSDRVVRIEGKIAPPLDLGLQVRTKNFTGTPSFGRRVVLYDSSWDDEVDATADEPDRAAALFASDVRGALLRLNAETAGFRLDDETAVASVLPYDVNGTVQLLEHVARLTRLVTSARRAVPPAGPVAAHTAAGVAFAAANGLAVEHTPFHTWGVLREVQVFAGFLRTGTRAFDLEVWAAAATAAHGFGLLVRRESVLDRVRTLFGSQDLSTGDGAFDPAFLVQAREGERAIALLDGDVRALLLELRARFETVTLSDAGLRLRGPAGRVRPEDMAMVIETACTLVERAARASAAVPRGAYR